MTTSASNNGFKKALNYLTNILFAVAMVLLVISVFYMVKSKIEGGAPSLGGYNVYIVLSGSMSPEFDAGSVIGVKPVDPQKLVKGDIITFKDPGDSKMIVTHRIADIESVNGLSFITRGDANDANDSTAVPAENILGQATISVPYVGLFINFTRSKNGLLLLFILPGLIFIIYELRHLYKYAGKYDAGKKMIQKENQLAVDPLEKVDGKSEQHS